MFEAINQTENSAKNIMPTNQESGGQAITIRASPDQDAMFLANNIQRRFKYGEASRGNHPMRSTGQQGSSWENRIILTTHPEMG